MSQTACDFPKLHFFADFLSTLQEAEVLIIEEDTTHFY